MADGIGRQGFVVLVLVVFMLALSARLYKIWEYPVSLSMDEVSIGYNAYSILETGKDEWGNKFPLYFKSVGDYKPPVNVYLTTMPVFIWGLNEFSVRFVSAFLGACSVVVFIFILKEYGFGRSVSVAGGFWFAVMPWHVFFSRGSFEAVSALFLVILGWLLFLVGIRKRKARYVYLSAFWFVVSMWCYHAERVFVPLMIIALAVIYRKEMGFLFAGRGKVVLGFFWSLVLVLPLLWLGLFTPAVRQRAASTSIMRDQSLQMNLHYGGYESAGEAIFDNNYYLVFRHFWGKYLNYFDLGFWFVDGLGMTPRGFMGIGLFYMADFIFIIFGLAMLVKRRSTKVGKVGIAWFLAGPVASSMTMNEQHTLRVLVWLPVFGLAWASGFEYFMQMRRRTLMAGVYIVLLGLNAVYFYDMYFIQYPRYFSEYWQYGYKEAATYGCEHKDEYEEVIITDTFGSDGPLNTGIPYMYVLFYCGYDPQRFIENGRKIEGFSFRRPDWKNDSRKRDVLLVASPWDLEGNAIPESNIIKTTRFLNDKEAFVYAKTEE